MSAAPNGCSRLSEPSISEGANPMEVAADLALEAGGLWGLLSGDVNIEASVLGVNR
jgi:hypothetical protein